MECCFCISGLKGEKNLCIVFQQGLNNVQSVLLGMRPTRYFQLCSPPLQLKGILIGWGMSATSCITEREPIMPAAGWCISDVWNSWVQRGGCFREAGRERCEAEGSRQQPAFFLVCLGIAEFSKGHGAFLWLKHWIGNQKVWILLLTQKSATMKKWGGWNYNLFMTQFFYH